MSRALATFLKVYLHIMSLGFCSVIDVLNIVNSYQIYASYIFNTLALIKSNIIILHIFEIVNQALSYLRFPTLMGLCYFY